LFLSGVLELGAGQQSSEVTTDRRAIWAVLLRSLKLRCPACGKSSLIERPFHIRHHCPECRSLFKREEGFFVGAILANVITTEFIILVVCLFSLLVVGASYEKVLIGLFIVAVTFPLLFFHHSWSLWLAFDYLIESLPKYDESKRRR
jgi:uncharacterized protein (DUF983 family)